MRAKTLSRVHPGRAVSYVRCSRYTCTVWYTCTVTAVQSGPKVTAGGQVCCSDDWAFGSPAAWSRIGRLNIPIAAGWCVTLAPPGPYNSIFVVCSFFFCFDRKAPHGLACGTAFSPAARLATAPQSSHGIQVWHHGWTHWHVRRHARPTSTHQRARRTSH